eukprot:XP_003725206.1 PREDICTED: deoxyribonuclease-1 [Strongylocentrotus purpuratus]
MASIRYIFASVVVFAAFLTAAYACTGSTIAAFNIQVLGQSKMGKPEVVDYLKQIIAQYDLVLIQEIRDVAGTAIVELLDAVNSQPGSNFKMTLGPRVGRSSSKEQYAYFYREDKFQALDSFSYDDQTDGFEREPFVVLFENLDKGAAVSKFSIIGLHSKPTDAVNEVDLLVDVYAASKERFGVEDSILMGDFNADCSYLTRTEFETVRLWTDTSFQWLIPSSADTTVKSTDCAYDRIVLAGQNLIANSKDAGIFNYHERYGITTDLAEDISDHYPVYFTIN